MPDASEPVSPVPNPRAARGEIIDLQTREVWQDTQPTPRDWWDGLQLEGKDFVPVVEGVPGAPTPKLPDGWSLRDVRIDADWIVELPAPAETYWFEGQISYQGPIERLPGGDRNA